MPERPLSPEQLAKEYAVAPHREGQYIRKGNLELFHPTDYKPSILVGDNPDSPTALITGWTDPQYVADKEIMENIALAASVRTPAGIELMLLNLARNPQINTILRYATGSTNETDRGKIPLKIVDALFRKEVDEEGRLIPTIEDDGTVIGAAFKLRPELVEDGALEVVREVVRNVELKDLSANAQPNFMKEIEESAKCPSIYIPLPVNLPEFSSIEVDTWPSEHMALVTRKKNAYDAWLNLVDKIMRYGKETVLETENQLTVRELPFAMVVLEGNEKPFDQMPEWANTSELKLTPSALENYYQDAFRPEKHTKEIFPGVFRYQRDSRIKYKYGEELHAYPNNSEAKKLFLKMAEITNLGIAMEVLDSSVNIDEETAKKVQEVVESDLSDAEAAKIIAELYYPPINQYQIAIDRLKTIPDDADKVFSFWNPVTHGNQLSGRPCLNRMAVLARDGKLNALAEFRSHDIKAWLENVYGLYRTLEDIATEAQLKFGRLAIISDSAHMYQQDKVWLVDVWSKNFCDRKLSGVFDDTNADQRGNIGLSFDDDNKLSLNLLDPESNGVIAKFNARNDREAIAQMNEFGWISQINHALYVGGELRTALLARDLGVEYVQDRPEITRRAIEQLIKGGKQ